MSAVDVSPVRGASAARAPSGSRRPRLGFAGVGWIGRLRMQALADSGLGTIAALADPSPDALDACREHAPDATCSRHFEALLEQDLDGIVIATPSAAHAAQATAALQGGMAVFCQKPLARTAAEAATVVAAAQRADRLLATDFSYRHVAGMAGLRERIGAGELGEVFAIDLHFHNAYGPDKDWFYDLEQAGGGCVLDLGIHLVDLAQWLCDGKAARELHDLDAHLFAGGRRLSTPLRQVEDYASVQWRRGDGVLVRLACSWRLQAGCDAMIGASVYGTGGGARWANVGGSFFDFDLDLLHGTRRERIASPPDDWGGRALVDWARRLAGGERFDPAVRDVVDVARTVDAIYGR